MATGTMPFQYEATRDDLTYAFIAKKDYGNYWKNWSGSSEG